MTTSVTRLLGALRTDLQLQARNQLYAISFAVALLSAAALAWLSPPDRLARTVPMTLLMFVGGSTLLYVVAMVILEKDDGVLGALAVTPLRPGEYLLAKVVSLTLLATMEGLIITGGAWWWLQRKQPLEVPSPLLFVGLLALGSFHVLVGVVLVVRYERLTEALLPMGLVATLFQLPALYFVGALDSPWLLAIPSGPPAMLVKGAFVPLTHLEWVYALVGTVVPMVVVAAWARRAYESHVVRRAA